MENVDVREEKARIWISVPKKHTKELVYLAAVGIVLLLGILLIGGYKFCIAAGALMIAITILIHFLLQKRITLANIIFYFDQGEMFLISLDKSDEKLHAYLHGLTDEKPASTEKPVDFLLRISDHSVIWHILVVYNVTELKSRPGNKKYRINMYFDLPRYTYDSALDIVIHQKRIEDFDGLIKTLQHMAES